MTKPVNYDKSVGNMIISVGCVISSAILAVITITDKVQYGKYSYFTIYIIPAVLIIGVGILTLTRKSTWGAGLIALIVVASIPRYYAFISGNLRN